MATISEIDPLSDPRWCAFLNRNDRATVFHSPEWLAALRRTYGYRPAALVMLGPKGELTNALAFCRVRSWLTGRRIVSVPFSDHCAPLVEGQPELRTLLSALKRGRTKEKYIEIRYLSQDSGSTLGFGVASTFCLHRLNLRPSREELLKGFHESCVRRRIARAERAQLTYEEGNSEGLVQKFYTLAVRTRRRQKLPPQPLAWFRNLVACLGNRLKIRLASSGTEPAAGILTLRYKGTMTYKYGCSDERFHRLGSMQLLLWKAIQEAQNEGLQEFDLGRTEWDNEGLITFKDRWGAARSTIEYLRYPAPKVQPAGASLPMWIARQLFGLAPNRLLSAAGKVLYRHVA